MCGNFGLLRIADAQPIEKNTSGFKGSRVYDAIDKADSNNASFVESLKLQRESKDELDESSHTEVEEASKNVGVIIASTESRRGSVDTITTKKRTFMQLFTDLAALNEFRGGQAGGISSFEYSQKDPALKPKVAHVRCVGRKRYTLADDMAKFYSQQSTAVRGEESTFTAIGHTHFATSSVNVESELHPHEWTPFHDEDVWRFDELSGKFLASRYEVGVHITHNGDFNALSAYGQELVIEEVGHWLEKVLHVPNDVRSDSVKIAGMLDLYRVQGRWAAAIRLGWIRSVMQDFSDAFEGGQIMKDCKSACPSMEFWGKWACVLDKVWRQHINNIIVPLSSTELGKFQYEINTNGLEQFEELLVDLIWGFVTGDTDVTQNASSEQTVLAELVKIDWDIRTVRSFVHHTVRGFLRGDLYNAGTELLSRMVGSFGCQLHCTLEPGVVCIGSKGQPMAVAFDPDFNICIFGSESEALSLKVDENGRWLKELINLAIDGEVMRLGVRRSLREGSFDNREEDLSAEPVKMKYERKKQTAALRQQPSSGSLASLDIPCHSSKGMNFAEAESDHYGILLPSGIEIRSYSLTKYSEGTQEAIAARCVHIRNSPVRSTASQDLVGDDLKVLPRVLTTIDRVWGKNVSLDKIAGSALAEKLMLALTSRKKKERHHVDLIIGGAEVSLWMGEQFASDLRAVFNNINVVVLSTNKLLGLGNHDAQKIFFTGCDNNYEQNIDDFTCALLISQSGQTFPTLHTLNKLTKVVKDRLWILTGAFHSKMETALVKSFTEQGLVYKRDRVFNNYAGKRPAEPSTVAVAATWHTLSHILLCLVETMQERHSNRCKSYSWEEDIQERARIEATAVMEKTDFEEDETNNENVNKNGGTLFYGRKAESNDNDKEGKTMHQIISLTNGCIRDYRALLTSDTLLRNMSDIVGFAPDGTKLLGCTTRDQLEAKGKAWAAHINEPWHTLIYSGVYIFVTVTLGIPFFSVLAAIAVHIVRMTGVDLGDGSLGFSLVWPSSFTNQSISWVIFGLAVQAMDALLYIYIGKIIAKSCRVMFGRPVDARLGKRSLVIVETPCVHQMLENYVSKLFSMSYSFISLDVHGGCGLDHFVHRFTHRVSRGALIAVGRPDGRLCCLAKSESSILLSIKQACFIRNPTFTHDGSGPDIISVGHNPFIPNLGLASYVTLGCKSAPRRLFMDEYLHEKLKDDPKPDGSALLHYVRDAYESIILDQAQAQGPPEAKEQSRKDLILPDLKSRQGGANKPKSNQEDDNDLFHLPYGVHHVPREEPSFAATIRVDRLQATMKEQRKVEAAAAAAAAAAGTTRDEEDDHAQHSINDDPEKRLIFSQRLDALSRRVQASQQSLQHLYEGRVASLERYITFCVIFYHMAKDCSQPRLLPGWDIARSQSNLRVATTASPIAASVAEGDTQSREVLFILHKLIFRLRRFSTHH